MVYSAELGYDPEEWEECPPPDHFLAFGWFTRIVLALAAILFAFVFFYVLERRKTWAREERRASYASIQPLAERSDQLNDEEDEQAEEKIADAIRKAAIAAATNGTRTSRSRSRTTTPMRKRLSQAELVSLEKWEEEVKAMERRRLVASESPPPIQPAAPSADTNERPPGEPSSHVVGGSFSKSSDEPTVVPVADEQPAGRKAGTAGVAEVFDSPARTAPTPPSTPPGPPSESQSAALNEHYERLASELERKLWAEIQNEADASATPPADLQARLHRRHESEIKAAAAQLQKHATPEAQTAAEEFRRRFEDQIDSMVEEYNRMHGRSEAGAHSSNESDVEQFERVGDSPALFYPSESDDPDAEATSFTYEASPKDGRSPAVPRHALGTIFNEQGGDSPIPRVLINDKHAKKSSSSSEEGFVKIYSDLVEHIKEEDHQLQTAAPPRVEAEEQMREILQEYESVPAASEQPPTPLAQQREESKRPIAQITVQSPPEVQQLPLSPPLQPPAPSASAAEIPTPPAERRSVSPQPQLVPLGGYLGNFLQQYQQAPDGSLYPQGPDGMFYKQNKDGQLVPISSDLQDLLQQQQQSGLQQPLIKTTNGNIYQQGPNGQFFEQMSDGQMYRVPPAVQKLIQQEIQEALQLGERRSTEPQDFIRGPDGVLYEKGPLGQFYEPGPDGKLHRVTPDVQRQLLDLVEEQKKWEKETSGEGRGGVKFEDQQTSASPSPMERQFDPAVIQTPDGKIFEMASDGSFYQLGRDGRLYRIPYELQTQLQKRHKAMAAEKKARDEQKRAVGGTSTESEPPPFDPEYPYHPKRKVPMQPHPDSKTPPAVGSPAPDSAYDAEQPEFSPSELNAWRQNPEQIPPEFRDLVHAALKADELQRQQLQPDPNEAARVRELLHEYDLSTSTEAPREQRETRPSPSAEQIQQQLKILDPNAAASSGPASPSDFDLLQAPGEELAVLRSQPQSPSVSSGAAAQHQQQAAPRVELQTPASPPHFDHRSATQPPPGKEEEDAQKYRESSEQLAARDHRKQLAREAAEDAADEADDPRRRAAAEIFLQDAIDYVDNQNRTASLGFVVEEDMLASEKLPAQMQNASAEPTSRLIRTNDVFEKPEPGFDDGDDAVTYAPEIQSEEVPPDQVSQASSNMIDQLPDEMLYPDPTTPLQIERPSAPLPISASSPQLLPRDSPERNEQPEEPQELPQRHQQHRISVQHPQLLFDPLQEPPVQPQIPSSETPLRGVDADDDDVVVAAQSPQSIQHHLEQQARQQPEQQLPPTTTTSSRSRSPEREHVHLQERHGQPLSSTQQSAFPFDPTLRPTPPATGGGAGGVGGGQQREAEQRKRVEAGGGDGVRDREASAAAEPLAGPLLLHQPAAAHVADPAGAQQRAPEAPQFFSVRKRRSSPGDFDSASVSSRSSRASTRSLQKQSSLLSALGVTSMQEMLLTLTSIEELSAAMRKAGLETTNLIFGVDYTASNKYQGEHSFDGRSLHFVEDPTVENPYQQVIKIMGRSLAPFINEATGIPVYGFGDNESGDWGVFPLNGTDGICRDLSDVLKVYNEVTPTIALGGPTNFAPLIFQAIQLCQRNQDYHILIITCDGQVTNERATRKAIVQACQFPLSIIVVGVGDGPWEMMRVFDESLPKRPWDNFHFVTFSDIIRSPQDPAGELAFAIQTLLEVPDQYHHIVRMGLVPNKQPSSTR